MEHSFLFPLMQKLWKLIKKCKTYSRKATGLFFTGHGVETNCCCLSTMVQMLVSLGPYPGSRFRSAATNVMSFSTFALSTCSRALIISSSSASWAGHAVEPRRCATQKTLEFRQQKFLGIGNFSCREKATDNLHHGRTTAPFAMYASSSLTTSRFSVFSTTVCLAGLEDLAERVTP